MKDHPHRPVLLARGNGEGLLAVIQPLEIALAKGGGHKGLKGVHAAGIVLHHRHQFLVPGGFHPQGLLGGLSPRGSRSKGLGRYGREIHRFFQIIGQVLYSITYPNPIRPGIHRRS
jgi:hypothetical protein